MPNKIRLALVLLLVLLFSGVGFAALDPVQPKKGDGTTDNPFEITSAAELYWLASTVNDGKCASTVGKGNCSAKLMEDITVNKYVLTDENGASKVGADGTYKGTAPENVWTPIGNRSRQYKGVFDGDGHTISGVYFNNANKDTVGLFGVLSTGSVKGVGVTDSYIRGRNFVGGIVGFNMSFSNNAVTDVYNAGNVSGNNYVGGILGLNSGSVGNVYNTGNVSGNNYVGGIVGRNQGGKQGSLYNAYSIGAVSGKNNVGGVAGSNDGGASISNSYYNVEFFSGSAVGVNQGGSSTNEVYGMSSVDFAFLDIEKAFPESDAWVRFGGEQPIMDNGKLFYKLPGLKTFKDVYPEVESRVLGIGTAEQLMEFAQQVNAGDTKINAKLTAHIVLNKNVLKDGTLNGGGSSFTKWTPIGTAANPYEGTFDGGGFTISGLYINDNEKDTVGLFGKIANTGVVKKLGMLDSYIKGRNDVGGVVGYNDGGSVSDVYGTCFVSGNQKVGGLVGYNKGAVSSVYEVGSVSGVESGVGGIVGYNDGGSVSNGYFDMNMPCENCSNLAGVQGLLISELAKTLPTGFSKDVWETGSIETDNDGNVIFKLHYLKGANTVPPVVMLDVDTDKYLKISNERDLNLFAGLVNSGATEINAKLAAHIVLNANVLKDGALNGEGSGFTSWTPIGTQAYPYVGTFDGKGFTVSGLYFNDDDVSAVGFFGRLGKEGTVKNVGIADSYLKGDTYVGAVVGANSGSVSNVYNAGAVVIGLSHVGGVVGSGSVSVAYNAGAVSGKNNVGGVVGSCSGSVRDVYNIGPVNGSASGVSGVYVGGVVGWLSGCSVINAYNAGSVDGRLSIGGLVGKNDGGSVSNSYYNTEIFNGNAVGTTLNSGSLTNVSGKTALELATFDVSEAFSGSDAWVRYEGEQPVLENGKLIYKLPGLKTFKDVYPEYVLLQLKNGVYEIGTANQLKGFVQFVNNGNSKANAKLTADIVLNKDVLEDENGVSKVDVNGNYKGTIPANVWTPINSFEGTFNGDGHTISGLYFNTPNALAVGFFNTIEETGVVENLGVINSYIHAFRYVGGIAGGIHGGKIRNVFFTGSVIADNDYAGGIASFNSRGTIENAYNMGFVSGWKYPGGIVGSNDGGAVKNVYNAGSVVCGDNFAGGIAGLNGNGGSIKYAYYNTDAFQGNVIGDGNGTMVGARGASAAELATLDVSEAFPGSEAWTRYEGSQPVLENGKLVYKLPGLKAFGVYPEVIFMQPKDGVYEIGTADQLICFARFVNNGNTKANAKLTANIELNKDVFKDGKLNVADTSKFTKWTPIESFEGTFDGAGHTVSGLYINNPSASFGGFISKLKKNGVVKNVGVIDSYVNGSSYVGGLVGHNEDGKVSCVYYTGSVVANSEYVGGIVGYNNRGAIGDVYNTGSVSGQRYVGGIVGSNDGGAVTNVYNVGIVKGSEETVGGIAGFNGRDGASIKYGYYSTDSFKGNVSGEGNGTIESSMGKTMSDLVSLDVNKDFPGSDAWSNYEGEQPILKDDWSVIYKLPGLTAFKNVYPEVVDPSVYEIGSVEQLKEFARRVNNGEIKINARLTADIVLNKNVLDGDFLSGDGSNFSQWTPIGTEKNPYQGIFNGNGHTISGIYVNNSGMEYVGLFGIIENKGVVANVGIVDSYIAGGLFVGGIVGFNKGSVTRAFNMAMVMGGSYFGGIAGKSEGFISDVYNMNSVSGIGDHVGGIVGENAGSVRNVYSAGSVKGGNWDVGSVIGNNAGEGTVHNAYYVSDMACYNCKDNGLARGLSREQLSSLDISSAFPESDAWMVYSGKQPVLSDDGETVYKLPGLKVFNAYPEINVESYGGVIEIKTAAQLKGLAQRVNNGDTKIDVVLGADICLNACDEGEMPLLEQIANGKSDFVQWTPIGLIGKPYVGNFDGRGHTIRGLYIDNEKMDQVGLFGVIGVSGTAAGVSASVKNVGLIDSYVKGADVVGGVVGLNDKASISDVYNAGTVYGAWMVGGVVGRNNSGSATNVYNLGEVKGYLFVGGVVGESNGSVSRVYNDALVSGAQYVGGVVGDNSGKVSDAYNMGSVSSEGYRVGGVVGNNMAFVDNVYSSADVKAPGYDGGAVGYSQGGSINNVYYNTDMICEHCGGSVGFVEGEAFVTNASGMTTAQLAALDVAEAFKGSEAWVNAPKDNPTKNNGKLIYKLPGLKAFSGLYPDVEFTVYQISNADELKQFALRVNNGENKIHGELTRNIELNSGVLKDGSLNVADSSKFTKWTPIGTNANPYAGVFDGKGFTISGLYFNDATKDTVGLFGKIANSGTVKNVGLIDSYINGKNDIGGIVGYEDGCFFSNVYNTGVVVGNDEVGGVAGVSRGTLSEVYNMGSVKGDAYVGGVVGYKEYGSVAKNYNMGAVSGYYEVGGLVGRNANASVSNSYNKGKVSVVKADGYVVGGIVGHNLFGALVNDVYNTGEVIAYNHVGGIVGAFEDGSMSNAYSSADVSGNGLVGGTVGYSKNGSISNVYYNTDMICKNCGGSVGFVEGDASVTNAFGKTTVQLAALDVASAFPNAEGIWKSGSVVNGENGTVIYKLPYLSKFEESNQPSITGSLEVSVANNDVYLKSDAVTNEDFKVSLVVNGHRSADKDGEFKFTKSTWGEDGVVKGTYDGFDFKVVSPSVVISSDKKKAKVFGYSENTVEIAENVDVPKIDFTRKLYKGKFSTVMFPFTPNEAIKNSGFYRFKDVSKNAEGKWQVHLGKAKEVLANTPYIMVVGDNGDGKEYVESISLNEGGVFSATPLKEYAVSGCLEEHLPDCVESGWKFIGSYEYTKWTDDNERASEIGKTYAFAGANGLSQGMKIGQFAKVGTGAYLYPMRAYLQYTGGAKAARAVPGSAREPAVSAELPENIDVVVDGESDSDEKTTVIGSFNTRTGEITPVKDSYFDVKGRNLGNKKPNVKGSFYRQ